MSAGPRIVFTRFLTGDSPKLVPWMTHLHRVSLGFASTPGETTGFFGDGVVVWQLVSANNRQLARGASVHETFESASASARLVIDVSAELTVRPVSEPNRGSYGWLVLDGETVVMTCGRWYPTERDRAHSAEVALRSLTRATLLPGTRQIYASLMERPTEVVDH